MAEGNLTSNEKTCPKCGTSLEPYHEVDIGVGIMTGGPWGCPVCHYVESQEPLPDLQPLCGATMGRAVCGQPKGHEGAHIFEEDFL